MVCTLFHPLSPNPQYPSNMGKRNRFLTDRVLDISGELMAMFDEQGEKLKGLINNMVASLQLKFVNTTIVCSVFSVPKRALVPIIIFYTLPEPPRTTFADLPSKNQESRILFRRAGRLPVSDKAHEEGIQGLRGTG